MRFAGGPYSAMESRDVIQVEVAYASPHEQLVISLQVTRGTTLEDAVRASGILNRFPQIDLSNNNAGVFGKPRDLAYQLRDGDRVEIYRPLIVDPKAARRLRAGK